MAEFTGPDSVSNEKTIQRTARVLWSRKRCWHGDTVSIVVGAEPYLEARKVELKILSEDKTQEIEEVSPGNLVASNLIHDYEVKWQDKPFEDKKTFVVKAEIDTVLETEASAPLWVDLEVPLFSA